MGHDIGVAPDKHPPRVRDLFWLQRAGGNAAVSKLIALGRPAVQRLVETNGGRFDTSTYQAVTDTSMSPTQVGADIRLTFTPNDAVEAPTIGLVQTNQRLGSPGATTGPPTDAAPGLVGEPVLSARAGTAPGEQGTLIDRSGYSGVDSSGTLPNVNPMYGVHNVAGSTPALTDTPNGGTAQYGSRSRDASGRWRTVPAWLSDNPRQDVGRQWHDSFETAALALDGPLAGAYLGSIIWGWRSDATGNPRLDPSAIRLASAGPPTEQFMRAAARWNQQVISDPSTGTAHPTLDLPITGVSRAPVATMTTAQLLGESSTLRVAIPTLPAGADRVNSEARRRAIEAEIGRRSVTIAVQCLVSSDNFGGDEIYVRLSRNGRQVGSAVKAMRAGTAEDFTVPLAPLRPVDGPIRVEVVEQDVLHDDVQVSETWTPPFEVLRASPVPHGSAVWAEGTYAFQASLPR